MSSNANADKNSKSYMQQISEAIQKDAKCDILQFDRVFDEYTDIQYVPTNFGVKENIIIKKFTGLNKFEFKLNLQGLYPEKQKNGPTLLKDKVTNEVKGAIPNPFMFDSARNEHYSEDISTTIEKTDAVNDEYKLTYVLDEDYFKNPDVVYPVTVDPTVSVSGCYDTNDADVESIHPDRNDWLKSSLRVGYDSRTGYIRSYIKFPQLPSIGDGTITAAAFGAYGLTSSVASDNYADVELHRVNENWLSRSITWNNKPDYGVCEYTQKISNNNYYYWNITDLVKDWYNGKTSNNGFMLKDAHETWQFRRFCSSDGDCNEVPYIIINYINPVKTLKAYAYGGDLNSSSGYVNLTWEPVSGVKGYYVGINNGSDYEYYDLGNVNSWSSKGKGIWPTLAEASNGRYQLHHDNKGIELPDDPNYSYQKSNGSISDKTKHSYSFKIIPYDDYGYCNANTCNSQEVTIPDRTCPDNVANIITQFVNNPAINEANSWKIHVTWNHAVDKPLANASSVNQYEIILRKKGVDGTFKPVNTIKVSCNINECYFNTLEDSSIYDVCIKTYDKNGNYTINPTSSSSFITEDRTPPNQPETLTISKEFGNLKYNPVISWTGIKDKSTLKTIQYKIDFNNWIDIGSNLEKDSKEIDSSNVIEGEHQIYVRGVDINGNYGDSKSVRYIKDTINLTLTHFDRHEELVLY